MAVAADLQADVVALFPTRAAASPHFDLYENIAALDERLEILIVSAVDVVLGQLENRRRLGFEV